MKELQGLDPEMIARIHLLRRRFRRSVCETLTNALSMTLTQRQSLGKPFGICLCVCLSLSILTATPASTQFCEKVQISSCGSPRFLLSPTSFSFSLRSTSLRFAAHETLTLFRFSGENVGRSEGDTHKDIFSKYSAPAPVRVTMSYKPEETSMISTSLHEPLWYAHERIHQRQKEYIID